MLTSSWILVELYARMQDLGGFQKAYALARDLQASRRLQIVRPTESDELRALLQWCDYGPVGADWVDAMSFSIMRARRVSAAFTTDLEHFGAAGFEVLPMQAS